jgi:phage shock protein PspC (stress-responsive transcriptional regulator)
MVGMTQIPGPTTAPTHEPPALDRFFDWLRSLDLRRDTEDKWLAGVCSGIATRLGVDPIVIRAALVVLVLLGGIGVTIYLIAWAFIPNQANEVVAEKAIRHGDVRGVILLALIALSLLGGVGFGRDNAGWFWWVVVPIGVVVWLVTRGKGRDRTGPRATYAAVPGFPAATSASTGTPYAGMPDGTTPSRDTGAAYAAPAGATTAPSGAPSAPSWGAPTTPPPAPLAARPPRAPRPPRRRGSGFVGAVLVGGLALAAYGLTVWFHDANAWSGSAETIGLAVALAVVGAGTLVLGLVGRRAGLTGFIAVVLALATWTSAVVPNIELGGGVGDRLWRPGDSTTGSYRVGLGQGTLDLGDYPHGVTPVPTIKANVGVGELRVVVPRDLTVQVRSHVGIGDITGSSDPFGNSDASRDISTTETIGSGEPEVVVDARVGIGQVTVIKE